MHKMLSDFGIFMTLVRLIKMCLNQNYSKVKTGEHLSDIRPVEEGLK